MPQESTPQMTGHGFFPLSLAARYEKLAEERDAQKGPRYFRLNYALLFWLFFIGSILGLGLETIYHLVVFGGWESRAGLVWGPFSPIYGSGACILTLLLNRYYYKHDLIIFLISMAIGSVIEYCTSFGMEVLWNAVAWDYSGTFGSINGRTNFMFGMMWGLLGLFWVRILFPVLKKGFSLIDLKKAATVSLTWIMSLFMLFNIVVSCLALERQSERLDNIPAHTRIDQLIDKHFPNEWMEKRFENMTVSPRQ